MTQVFSIGGCRLPYEILGERGPLVAVTPGGRAGRDSVRALGEALAARCRVLLWDRRNAGHADLYFGPEPSEQALWADDLGALIESLGLGPAIVAGGSAGARVSLLTAIRHPSQVRALAVWACSGGRFGCQYLGYNYHVPFMFAAMAGGMKAVAKAPFFAAHLAANPDQRDRFLALDPQAFIGTMRRWNHSFYYDPSTPVIGATVDELKALAKPVLLFEGNDPIHPKEVSDAVQRLLPDVEVTSPPWTGEEYMSYITGQRAGGVIETQFPRVAPRVLQFIERL